MKTQLELMTQINDAKSQVNDAKWRLMTQNALNDAKYPTCYYIHGRKNKSRYRGEQVRKFASFSSFASLTLGGEDRLLSVIDHDFGDVMVDNLAISAQYGGCVRPGFNLKRTIKRKVKKRKRKGLVVYFPQKEVDNDKPA